MAEPSPRLAIWSKEGIAVDLRADGPDPAGRAPASKRSASDMQEELEDAPRESPAWLGVLDAVDQPPRTRAAAAMERKRQRAARDFVDALRGHLVDGAGAAAAARLSAAGDLAQATVDAICRPQVFPAARELEQCADGAAPRVKHRAFLEGRSGGAASEPKALAAHLRSSCLAAERLARLHGRLEAASAAVRGARASAEAEALEAGARLADMEELRRKVPIVRTYKAARRRVAFREAERLLVEADAAEAAASSEQQGPVGALVDMEAAIKARLEALDAMEALGAELRAVAKVALASPAGAEGAQGQA